jgi:2-polyprenyl-3-methyl-5-hydroxy-6-metoxy-1,4-benzoquinol methylase
MLKNDEIYWEPDEQRNAALLSWGGSEGDFAVLWAHTQQRWGWILQALARTGVPAPSGRVVEFGSGMGLLDDLLDHTTSSIVMLDHTEAYLEQRPRPLSPRCRHVRWSSEALDGLQTERGSYDWLLSVAVFYHVDDATAVALIRELGELLRPGGYVVIAGWNPATPDHVRDMADRQRLFARYPRYVLNVDLLRATLALEYEELCREGILLYRKLPGAVEAVRS